MLFILAKRTRCQSAMSKTFIAITGFLLLFAACKKKNETPDFYYDYFPLTEGHYVTYHVREIRIDTSLNLNDTSEFYLKAVIGDDIIDNEGRTAKRYNRYVRQNLTDPWVLQDIWTTILDDGRLELVEENQRTIKLVFAPSKYKEWNANAYNMLGDQECYYTDLHEPGSINGFSFDSTVTVEQEEFFSLIDYRRKYEQYAKGVGMYYKRFTDYKITGFDINHVVKGREVIMQLIDHGME